MERPARSSTLLVMGANRVPMMDTEANVGVLEQWLSTISAGSSALRKITDTSLLEPALSTYGVHKVALEQESSHEIKPEITISSLAASVLHPLSTLAEEDCYHAAKLVVQHLDRQIEELYHAAWTFPTRDLAVFQQMNTPQVLFTICLLVALYATSHAYGIGETAGYYMERAADAGVLSKTLEPAVLLHYQQSLPALIGDGDLKCNLCLGSYELSIITADEIGVDFDKGIDYSAASWESAPQLWPEDEMDFDAPVEDWSSQPASQTQDDAKDNNDDIEGEEYTLVADNFSENDEEADSDDDDNNHDHCTEPEEETESTCFISKTRCGHSFCSDCLDLWVEISYRCPECRELL
ncbi:hypothetical protein HDK90DRAFT_515709 [Phyllosticta capitalensis]|uniref:RING-type domain-containing protein n=1 Tax=Phyllosticta capitalensis TaxID=121624 RepID=A0ABR1YAH2_9PEZI